MTTAIITNTVVLPDGTTPSNLYVRFQLIGSTSAPLTSAYVTATGALVDGVTEINSTNGQWTATLQLNSGTNLTPAGTQYQVTQVVLNAQGHPITYVDYISVTGSGTMAAMVTPGAPGSLPAAGSQVYTDAQLTAHVAAVDPHTGYTRKSANLSDLASPATARSNLGVNAAVAFNIKDYGAIYADGTNVAATTTAIQAAINAAESAGYSSGVGATVFFPPGYYKTNAVLTWTKAVKLQGASRGGTLLQNDTTDLFNPNGNGWSVQSMQLNGVGGHIFAPTGVGNAMAELRDLTCLMYNTGKSIWYQNGAPVYIDMLVEHCDLYMAASATVPGWYMVGNQSGLNSNTWRRLRITGQSGSPYFFHIEETQASGYSFNNEFSSITGELCAGGMIKGLSPHSWTIRNVQNYDTTTYTADLFFFSKTTGADPKAVQMVSCGRRGGTLAGGVKDLTITGTGNGHVLTNIGPASGSPVLNVPTGGVTLFQSAGPQFNDPVAFTPFGGTAAVTIGNAYASSPGLLLKPASGPGYSVDQLQVQTDTGVQRLAIGAGGWLDMTQQTAPAAPAATTARLFVRDNGAGKTQVCVRFPTGAVQILATEP